MKLVFATHNAHKLKEIQALVPDTIEIISLTDIACHEEIPETATTIEGNAHLKAEYVHTHYGLACFADDTGLEVEALNGAPGVFSARYAGPAKRDSDNVDKLLRELANQSNRKAHFKTVISLIIEGKKVDFTGICKGKILPERHGNNGFGYDPIFQPEGYNTSFAEMSAEEKNKISHRGKATRQLLDYLHKIK